MDAVQLQCGNCQKLMAISPEHLGGQVQCPHCRAIVQTPASAPAKAPAMQLDERDSIFASEATEDVIGVAGGARPDPDRTILEPTVAAAVSAETPPQVDAESDLTSFKRPRLHGAGMGPTLVLIFLVPYAILMTLFVAYLVYVAQTRPHPLDMLPDPAPGKDKGAPRPARFQVIHNHELAEHQKTRLGQAIKIGDLVVEPRQVRANEYNELLLVLRTRNTSEGTAFVPIDESFVRYTERPDDTGKPYTFLEVKSQKVGNLYGAIPSYLNAQGEPIAMRLLRPGEEATLGLLTTPQYRTRVAKILAGSDRYLWRVQLRRGLVKHNGKNISATAVIGIEFTSEQIVRDARKGEV